MAAIAEEEVLKYVNVISWLFLAGVTPSQAKNKHGNEKVRKIVRVKSGGGQALVVDCNHQSIGTDALRCCFFECTWLWCLPMKKILTQLGMNTSADGYR